MRIRLARPGDGADVARLADIALQGRSSAAASGGDLVAAIDQFGGRLKVPYGWGRALVAESSGCVVGLWYSTPPVRLVESCADLGANAQGRMADALAEVELLAVDAEERRRGVGSELLRVGEEMLRGRGVRAVLVKVLEDDVAVMKWYSERGYRVLSSGEVFALRGGFGVVGLQNEDDGYRLGIKQLV